MRNIVLFLCLVMALGAQAQVGKLKKLYLSPAFYKIDVIYSDENCLALYDVVEKCLARSQRFEIINSKSLNEAFSGNFETAQLKEIETRQIQKAKDNQAQLIGIIYINSLTTRAGAMSELGKRNNPLNGFFADIDFTLKILNVEKELTVLEEVFSVKGGKGKLIRLPKPTKEEAITDVIKNSEEVITSYMKNILPPAFDIFKIEKESKKALQDVIVTIGEYYNIRSGMYRIHPTNCVLRG